jgi:hypothetical protein
MEKKMNRRKFLKASAAGGALMIAGDFLKGGSPVAYGEVAIARDDVFNAAKTPLVLLYAYSNTVAQELGRERAVGLMTKMFENIGAGQGKRMKEKAGSKEFDAKEAWPYFKTFPDTVGQTYQVVEESPQRVVARMRRCPLYEAARMLGMDSSTIARPAAVLAF